MSDFSKGLAGVVVDESRISKVLGQTSELLYRGYPVAELVEKCSFEEVVYLLWEGELPSKSKKESFEKMEIKMRPQLDSDVLYLLEHLKDAHPMDAIRTLISWWAAKGFPWDQTLAERKRKAFRFLSATPVFVAAHFRMRKNQKPIFPDRELSFSENFLKMCFDKNYSKEQVELFDKSMILYAEHGFNASTFAARVIASTTSDVGSALTGAIGALKGPLHGGANERVMEVMKKLKNKEAAKKYIKKALKNKEKIMGFGHRVYKKEDSRVKAMKECAEKMSEMKGEATWMEIYEAMAQIMKEEKNIYPNVDFPAGPFYYLMGFDIDVFTPLFVIARMAGWCAHIIEQSENNRIIRPLCEYKGEEKRPVPR